MMSTPDVALDDVPTAIVTRLDRLISLFSLAYQEELDAARARIRQDDANAAILDATQGRWAPAGTLRDLVVKRTGLKQAAVRARMADLVDAGVLERQGGGPTTEYRSTGVV